MRIRLAALIIGVAFIGRHSEATAPDGMRRLGTQRRRSSSPAARAHVELEGLCIDSCAGQPAATPPVAAPSRDSLTATLPTNVGNDVTFTFTVTNTRNASTDVQFNDAHQFDLRVWDANDSLAWRWRAGQFFSQSLTTRTVAPSESLTYVAHWKPAAPGNYHAMAHLASWSHAAVGSRTFSSP